MKISLQSKQKANNTKKKDMGETLGWLYFYSNQQNKIRNQQFKNTTIYYNKNKKLKVQQT